MKCYLSSTILFIQCMHGGGAKIIAIYYAIQSTKFLCYVIITNQKHV